MRGVVSLLRLLEEFLGSDGETLNTIDKATYNAEHVPHDSGGAISSEVGPIYFRESFMAWIQKKKHTYIIVSAPTDIHILYKRTAFFPGDLPLFLVQ